MSVPGASKRCPQCGALAMLNAPLCLTCGREFRGTVGQGAPDTNPALPPVVAPVTPPPPLGAAPPPVPNDGDDDDDDDLAPAHSEEDAEAGTRLSLGLIAIFVVGTVLLAIVFSLRGAGPERNPAPAANAALPVQSQAAPAPARAPVIASPGDVAVEDPPSASSETASPETSTPTSTVPGPSAPRPDVPALPNPGAPTAPVGPPVIVVSSEIVFESNSEAGSQYGARMTLRNDGGSIVRHVRADVTARNAAGEHVFEMKDVELLPEGTTLAPGETTTIEPSPALRFPGTGANPPTALQILIVGISL